MPLSLEVRVPLVSLPENDLCTQLWPGHDLDIELCSCELSLGVYCKTTHVIKTNLAFQNRWGVGGGGNVDSSGSHHPPFTDLYNQLTELFPHTELEGLCLRFHFTLKKKKVCLREGEQGPLSAYVPPLLSTGQLDSFVQPPTPPLQYSYHHSTVTHKTAEARDGKNNRQTDVWTDRQRDRQMNNFIIISPSLKIKSNNLQCLHQE